MAPSKILKRRPFAKTAIVATPHPSGGHGFAYSTEYREFCQYIFHNGLENHPMIAEARQQRIFPSKRTIYRHNERFNRYGHLRPYKRQGNKRATVLRGLDGFMLAFYRVVWPKATQAELNAMLFQSQLARGIQHPRFFTPSQITKSEDRVGISRKRGSTTAYQALLPRNVARRWAYWNLPYPFGIADIPKDDWIDFDEAAIFVETANRKIGKMRIGQRVREEGPYNHTEKFTLTFAISGDVNGERWVDFDWRSGTSINDTYEFILRILESIGPGTPERRRCFTMDNLLSHVNPAVLNLIVAWGHRYVLRAPYYPVDGAVEYVFNTIQHELTIRLPLIKDSYDLRREINNIIANIDNFVRYFLNVGP